MNWSALLTIFQSWWTADQPDTYERLTKIIRQKETKK